MATSGRAFRARRLWALSGCIGTEQSFTSAASNELERELRQSAGAASDGCRRCLGNPLGNLAVIRRCRLQLSQRRKEVIQCLRTSGPGRIIAKPSGLIPTFCSLRGRTCGRPSNTGASVFMAAHQVVQQPLQLPGATGRSPKTARWPLIRQRRGGIAGLADQRGEFPVFGRFVMSKNVHPSIVGIYLEPALHRSEPSIDHAAHGKAARAEPEGKRLLVAAVAGVALHTNDHGATILLQWRAKSSAASGCEATFALLGLSFSSGRRIQPVNATV